MVKAIQKQRKIRQGRVAIITGEALNKKKISDIIAKLYGGALIIEKAGKLSERTVAKLNKAMEKDTGARALRAIIEEFMLDIMYEIPKDDSIGEVVITREYIEGNGGPKILLRGQEPILLEGSH